MEEPRVLIGVPHTQFMFSDFAVSMTNMHRPSEHCRVMWVGQKTLIDHARNSVCEVAINNDFTHVFFMDSDQTFPADALMHLLEHDKDVVSGIYPQRSFFMKPVMYRTNRKTKKMEHIIEWPNKLFPIDACGAGCLLVKTEVLRKLKKPWFLITETNVGGYVGEDFYFCKKVKEAGFNIWCDPRVQCGHVDLVEFTIEDFIKQRDRKREYENKKKSFTVKCMFCKKEFTDTMEGDLLYEYENNKDTPAPIADCPHCGKQTPFVDKEQLDILKPDLG